MRTRIFSLLLAVSAGAMFVPTTMFVQTIMAQTPQAPVFDTAYDANQRALRPILGSLGAAVVGPALDAGRPLQLAAVSSQRGYTLAVDGNDGSVALLASATGRVTSTVAGAPPRPAMLALSPTGAAAVLAYPRDRMLLVLGGLPDQPRVLRSLSLSGTGAKPLDSSIQTLAVSDDGAAVALFVRQKTAGNPGASRPPFEDPLGSQPPGTAERVVPPTDGAAPGGSRAFEDPLGSQPPGTAERVVPPTGGAAPGGSRTSQGFYADSSGAFTPLGNLANITAIAFPEGSHDALIADSTGIFRAHTGATALELTLLAGRGAGTPQIAALGISGANKKIYAASVEGDVMELDLTGGMLNTVAKCACKPDVMARMSGQARFRLNNLPDAPLWVFDGDAATPRLVFIPADPEPETVSRKGDFVR